MKIQIGANLLAWAIVFNRVSNILHDKAVYFNSVKMSEVASTYSSLFGCVWVMHYELIYQINK